MRILLDTKDLINLVEHSDPISTAEFDPSGPVRIQHDPKFERVVSISKDIPLLVGKVRTNTTNVTEAVQTAKPSGLV